MTGYGFGCVTITKNGGSLVGVFTDGDLRRLLQSEGEHILEKKMGEISYKSPVSIEADALLNDAVSIFKEKRVDTILVTKEGKPVGMLDIQDLENN